jgi:hypothetical protein
MSTQDTMPQDSQIESDFNVSDEFKPDPLCPVGTYKGHVIQVGFDAAGQAIVWTVALQGNSGTMSDGATPIDGQRYQYRNWLPRPGDEAIMTPKGRSTKRAAKISMLKQFADAMKVQMNSKEDIIKGITEGLWMGIPVICKLSLDTYEGRTRNNIDRMSRDESGSVITVLPDEERPF